MAAEKTAFLSGGELPDGALLKSMSVPTGKQGVHEKLKGLGWDEITPIACPLLRPDVTGNLVSTAWTLQVTFAGGTGYRVYFKGTRLESIRTQPISIPQGRAKPFSIKCADIWPNKRGALSETVVTIDLGMLSSWDFGDMNTQSNWVSQLLVGNWSSPPHLKRLP